MAEPGTDSEKTGGRAAGRHGRTGAVGPAVAAWAVVIWGLAAAPAPAQPVAQPAVLPVAAIVADSGRYATNGRQMRDAYRLAIDRANEAGLVVGGRRRMIELTLIDDESSPVVASRAAERAVRDQDYRFVLGPYGSGLARAIAPVVERYGAVMVEAAGAVRPGAARQVKSVFSLLAEPGNGMAAVVTAVAAVTGRHGTVRVMLATSEDWGAERQRAGAVAAADAAGMAVVAETSLLFGTPDLAPVLETVAREQPDLLLMISQAAGTRGLLQELAARKLSIGLVAATDCDLARVASLGEAGWGVVCPAAWNPRLLWSDPLFGSPEGFASAFDGRYRRPPSAAAAAAAAAVSVLVDGIRRAGSVAPGDVRREIATGAFETVIGPVAFDGAGRNTALQPPLLQYGPNGAELVGPAPAASATLRYPANRP